MKVSVYCLVFNHAPYLRSALDGFINQKTDFDLEVFVHDDASSDGSQEIIREYVEKYPNIIKPILQTENQHSQGIKILGAHILPRMAGEYIAVCEGDDYWTDPCKLQLQVDFLDAHPEYVACVHNTEQYHVEKKKSKIMYTYQEDTDLTLENVAQHGGACYHTSSLMYRRRYAFGRPAFFKKAKGFGDYPLAIYLALCGKIRVISRVMSVYRVGIPGSWTSRHSRSLEKSSQLHGNIAEMLEEVNRYTEYQYTNIFDPVILQAKYKQLLYKEDYAALRKEPFRQIYQKQSFSYKCKLFFRQYLNGLYHWYRRSICK